MLYSILKTIIETTIVQYVCQNCQGKILEHSISVGEIRDTQIDLDIVCPHCSSVAHIHAEVANVPGQPFQTGNEIERKTTIIPKNENAIKETDIRNIEENLEGNQTIEDLLK